MGLVLDKRLGLVPGANVLPTLDFTDTVAWLAVAGGTLTRDSASSFTTTASGGLRRSSTLSVGSWYRITFDYTATAGLGVRNAPSNANVVGTDVSAGSGVFSAFFNAIDTNLYFRLAAAGSLSVSNVVIRELPGNHATQSSSLLRPTYQIDSTGRPYLLFDGSDDFLVTPTITPGTDKAQLFAGVRKLSDAAAGCILESSTSYVTNAGAVAMFAPLVVAANEYAFAASGATASTGYRASTYVAPITSVLTGLFDLAGASRATNVTPRVNGQTPGTLTNVGSGVAGGGNFLAYPFYIGRRAGTINPLNGRVYSLIGRFGANLTTAQIALTETWVNGKTGAY